MRKKAKKKKIEIPSNHTEEEVVELIDKIANGLCREFRFGYYTLDDIRQQARLFALEALGRYDKDRPLENFLWVHVRNRLINFKRDEYERCESPCLKCKIRVKNECLYEDDNLSCIIYRKWLSRNSIKKNLMIPIEISSVEDEKEKNMKDYSYADEEMYHNEISKLIDKNLDTDFRSDYLKLIHNDFVTKSRKEEIQKEIAKILEEHHYDYEEKTR